MKPVIIHIYNELIPVIREAYYYPMFDITNQNEVEEAVDECIGAYLDTHIEDIRDYTLASYDTIKENCSYILEALR